MLKAVRMCLAIAALAVGVWACFSVKLGTRTFAEHMDAIGNTPQAEALVEGARETIHPAMERARSRVLGEYVTAPTYLEAERAPRQRVGEVPDARDHADEERTVESVYAGDAADDSASPRGAARATRAGTSRVPGAR